MTQTQGPRVRLVPTTLDQLDAYFRDPAELGEKLQVTLPEDWPLDPSVFLWVANALEHALVPDQRLMFWAIDEEAGALIGDGGFRSFDGSALEIIYEIAGSMRGRGYSEPLVRALCEVAFEDPEVDRLDAHPSPDDLASALVLLRIGFERLDRPSDPDATNEVGRFDSWTLYRRFL